MNNVQFIKIHGEFDWSAASTLLAGALAAVGVLVGLLASAGSTRRQHRNHIYSGAMNAVSDYLEAPYRVMRCPQDKELLFALSQDISNIQSRIDAHLVLVQMSARTKVFSAYEKYVQAARDEAGAQMREQWDEKAPKRRSQMHAPERFDQPRAMEARAVAIKEMAKDSKPMWRLWRYLF